jgi:hypothetical protein
MQRFWTIDPFHRKRPAEQSGALPRSIKQCGKRARSRSSEAEPLPAFERPMESTVLAEKQPLPPAPPEGYTGNAPPTLRVMSSRRRAHAPACGG